MAAIILTHCGKLGDFLYSLPVAEWFFQKGRPVHWVLPRAFTPFQHISTLLKNQPHCEEVTLVDYPVLNYEAGGQPYRFNPSDYGIEGEYFNLGFRRYPNKFISEFYAEEHGLDYVPGYTMSISGEPINKTQEILRSGETAMDKLAPQAESIPTNQDLLQLAQRIACAAEFHTWYCGLAVLAYMARIPQHVYRVQGHAEKRLYFPENRGIKWHEVKL